MMKRTITIKKSKRKKSLYHNLFYFVLYYIVYLFAALIMITEYNIYVILFSKTNKTSNFTKIFLNLRC